MSEEELIDISLALLRPKRMRARAIKFGFDALWLVIGIVMLAHGRVYWIGVAVIFIAIDVVGAVTVRPRALKSFRKRLKGAAPKAAVYEIDEQEIRVASESGARASLPWQLVVEVRPYKEALLLMLTETRYHYMSRRRFVSEYEWQQLVELARRRPWGSPLQ